MKGLLKATGRPIEGLQAAFTFVFKMPFEVSFKRYLRTFCRSLKAFERPLKVRYDTFKRSADGLLKTFERSFERPSKGLLNAFKRSSQMSLTGIENACQRHLKTCGRSLNRLSKAF